MIRWPGLPRLGLFGNVLGVLWLNGNANGHSTFLLLPQVLNWLLFFCMSAVIISNFLHTLAFSRLRPPPGSERPSTRRIHVHSTEDQVESTPSLCGFVAIW